MRWWELWEFTVTNYVTLGFYIQDVLKNKIVAATPNLPSFGEKIKVTSQDIFEFYFYILDAGYLTEKYKTAGYSTPLPEDLTMQVSIIGADDSGYAVATIFESPKKYITTWTAYSSYNWRYRLTMPPVYKHYVFSTIEVIIWSGRSNIVFLRVPLKHVKLSRLRLEPDKSTYTKGRRINLTVIGYDQDDKVIHPSIRFPLYLRIVRKSDNQVITQSPAQSAHSYMNIEISVNWDPGQYEIQASDNPDFKPDPIRL